MRWIDLNAGIEGVGALVLVTMSRLIYPTLMLMDHA